MKSKCKTVWNEFVEKCTFLLCKIWGYSDLWLISRVWGGFICDNIALLGTKSSGDYSTTIRIGGSFIGDVDAEFIDWFYG